MTERQEYTRLRKNILQRYGRIQELGLKSYVPEPKLGKESDLTDKQISGALKKARRYNERITVKNARNRRAKRLEQRRAKALEERLYKSGNKKDAYFIRGVRKWLKRQGKPITLINERNYREWQEYINYRTAIAGEKSKYEFDNYVEDMANMLTESEQKTDAAAVLRDFKQYIEEQQQFIQRAKEFFGEAPLEYSSAEISKRFF